MADHAKLAPSSASCWVKCPAAVKMEELYGSASSSAAADEGSLVHDVASCLLTGKPVPDCTADQLRAAEWYVSELRKIVTPLGVEQRLDLSALHPQCFGTCDAWGLTDTELVVADLKYGFGQVDAFENWQLTAYAAGLPHDRPTVKLVIFQPRPYPQIREWTVPTDQLLGYWEALRNSAAEALRLAPYMSAGSHCRYCSGRAYCEAARRAALEAVEVAFEHRELTPEQLSVELSVLTAAQEALTHRLTGLTAQATAHIESGKSLPGWMLDRTVGRKEWTVPAEDIITIADTYGVDVSKPGVVTPTQAAKLGLPGDLIDMFSARKAGTVSLKPCGPKTVAEMFK